MCAIWGTTWLAIKVALTGLPPVSGSGIRFVVAGAFLYALARVVPGRSGGRPPWPAIAVLAFTMFGANYGLTYYAETLLPSGLVAVLFGTMPFFIFGFAAVLLHERIGAQTLAGTLVAFAGVGAIFFTGEGGAWLPVTAALCASLLSAYANVHLKRFADADSFRTLPPAMLLAGLVSTATGAVFERVDLRAALAPAPVIATLYLAIVGSGIAFYLNQRLLRVLPSWIVGLSALVIPVVAVAVGALVAHEEFGPRELGGAALVLAGVSLALLQRKRAAGIGTDGLEAA